MNRRDFGTWGLRLSEADFAKALAAAGVLVSRPGEWPPPDSTPARIALALHSHAREREAPVTWRMLPPLAPFAEMFPPAENLAAGWSKFREEHFGVRLEIDEAWLPLARPNGVDPLWIVAQLSHPEVGALSVYLREGDRRRAVEWQWPLRLGVLNNLHSRRFRQEIRRTLLKENPWVARLVRLVGLQEESDVLLLPYDLEHALAAVLQERSIPQTDVALVLGGAWQSEGTARLLEALQDRLNAPAAAIAYAAERDRVYVIKELVRELSHNLPVDQAFFAMRRGEVASSPVLRLTCSPADFPLLSEQVDRMGKTFSAPELRGRHLSLRPESTVARNLRLPSLRKMPIASLGERLSQLPPDVGFYRESEMATAAAELGSAARKMAGEIVPARKPPRFIQSQVFDVSESTDRPERVHQFRPNRQYAISVRVGLPEEEWTGPGNRQPFPSGELPQDKPRNELTVVFTDRTLMPEPQVARVVLPRSGNSTGCTFYLHVPERARQVEGRIIVLHRNRILQTALLSGQVTRGERAAEESRIRMDVEVLTQTDMSDLHLRQPYDVAIVLNHDSQGVAAITTVKDGAVKIRPAEDMHATIQWFMSQLTNVAVDRKAFAEGLTCKASQDLLRSLACHGNALHGHLVTDLIGDRPLAQAHRMQVVSARPEAILPVEFVYEWDAPQDQAKLCPKAKAALKKGACSGACKYKNTQAQVICPMGFWGLTRVIERHAHTPDLPQELTSAEFALQEAPTESRRQLKVFAGGLLAGSQRVEKTVQGALAKLVDQLAAATKNGTGSADSWTLWEKHVAGHSPSLLMLLIHTEKESVDSEIRRMEIGKGSWLRSIDVKRAHILGPNAKHAIVFLLGCETGPAASSIQGLAAYFRRQGASIVISTDSTIHASHAVVVTEAFIDVLRNLSGKTSTFGEVMRKVRCRMLYRGYPMVLCLTAFGDADWQIQK